MTLENFKEAYAFRFTGDDWGETKEAWFECAGQMNKRGMKIPAKWKYKPGIKSDGTEPESMWYDDFEMATNEELIVLGDYLFDECRKLKKEGKDY